jgi:hypothetical protein
MKKWINNVGLVIVAAVVLVGLAGAEGDIKVLSSEAQPSFAKDIVFRLTAQSSQQIAEVELFYREMLEAATNRAYPDFKPGPRVEAQYTWDLLAGEVPVGAKIKFYWIIKDFNGQQLKTDPQFVTYDDTRFTWQDKTEGKVTLYSYGGDAGLAQGLLKGATDALKRISTEIGVEPEYPVKIYVYDSKTDMAAALVSRSESYDAMTTTLGVMISKDTLLLLGSAQGVDATMAHELTHLVVGQATDNPFHAPIPRWLDEGLAMYNEGRLPDYNQRALKDAIAKNKLISVRSLTAYTGDPSQVDLFYAESYSLVSYLLDKQGKDKMVHLLAVFKKGAYHEDALREVYGFGSDELDAQWRESIGARPRQVEPTAETASTRQPGSSTKAQGRPKGLLSCGALPGLGLAGLFAFSRSLGSVIPS